MKKILISGSLSGFILVLLSIVALYTTIWLLPNLALEYYDSAFRSDGRGAILYFFHPLILSLALAWFWERFKGVFKGNFLMRGIEFGLVYLIVATVPAMWIVYSAMSVTLTIALTWLVYGFIQAVIAGLIFERINP
jgi:hypothetical protein